MRKGAAEPVLPEFSIRESARARHVRLSVTARDGLVVVVPNGWRGDVRAIVESKRSWAHRALARVAEHRALLLAGAQALLPSEVELSAVGRRLTVEYRASKTRGRTTARVVGDILVVAGDIDDAEACLAALRRWSTREARDRLTARVAALAAAHGVHPSRVRVSTARTRWGSCSSRGVVSINRTALFLPPDLLDSLILHELAHLHVLDHSARFWSRLTEMDPSATAQRARMRTAGEFVPPWAHA